MPVQLRSNVAKAFVAVGIVMALPSAAAATEAAMGRYTPGLFVMPGVGIVPPIPGVYWQSSSFAYFGSAGKDLGIPIGGTTHFGLSGDIIATSMTGLWVPDIQLGNNLTLAISGTLPVGYMSAKASLGRFDASDHAAGLGDIMIAPTIGWHQGADFVSASVRIYAPTGWYEKDHLSNIGLNYWTFSPTLGYTHLDPTLGLDFSVLAGLDINTENPATNYTSGLMAHIDASLSKKFENNFGIGVFASALVQVTKDTGGLAAELDGFEGRSYAIGPMLTYVGGSKESPVNFSLNWAPEFGVKNRLEGNAVYFNVSGAF